MSLVWRRKRFEGDKFGVNFRVLLDANQSSSREINFQLRAKQISSNLRVASFVFSKQQQVENVNSELISAVWALYVTRVDILCLAQFCLQCMPAFVHATKRVLRGELQVTFAQVFVVLRLQFS